MKLYSYFFICLTIVLFSCKNDVPERPASLMTDGNDSEIVQDPIKQQRVEELRKKSKAVDVPALRGQAASILEFRSKNGEDSYAIIEADVWEYKFIYDGEMSDPGEYDGVWIDFLPDGSYEYGKGTEVQGGGRYNYHFERGELLMLDNDASEKPTEWSVKSAGDAMVLVGTATYKDNAIQMKLERVNESIRRRAN